jgi:peptide-methionine (S)-S-oxide reductase
MGRGARVVLFLVLAALGAVSFGRIFTGSARPGPGNTTAYARANPVRGQQVHTATFAAGCFWKLEHDLRRVPGVLATTPGYTGGRDAAPTHASVASARTGHAEAVRVAFDPAVVTYDALLDVFWSSHDPSQFAPRPEDEIPAGEMPGRSAIFFHDEAQRLAAAASVRRLDESGKYRVRVPTQVVPATTFHPAEADHQQYLEKQGARCRVR